MSRAAKVGGTLAAFAVVGGWSWHHGRFDGQTFAVIIGLTCVAAVLLLLDIDVSELDRAADPTRFNGERP